MRYALLPILLALLLCAAPANAAACAGADAVPTARNVREVRAATLCLLNEHRSAKGLPALRDNTPLERAATAYSRRMVRERFFGHTAPDGSTFDKRIVAAGYRRYDALAENIAWGTGGYATAARIVAGWMHSDGHRRNILDRKLRDIGIGIAPGAPQATGARAATYTTDFGSRP